MKQPAPFNQQYYLDHLSHFHRMFYAVFELGTPVYTHEISTAAVGWNSRTGQIVFMINPDFFYKLGLQEQLFILCHEALHVILQHMARSHFYKLNEDLANIVQDIVINEMLVRDFGFDRKTLNFGMTLCFVDTVFTQEQISEWNIPDDASFEFYYDLLVKSQEESEQGGGKGPGSPIDIHLDPDGAGGFTLTDGNGDIITSIPEEIAESIAGKIGKDLTADDLEDLLENLNQRYGQGAGGGLMSVTLEEKKRRPWERIIKNKIASLQLKRDHRKETFRMRPRRITNLAPDLYLPETVDEQHLENDKFHIVFFIDASGSCTRYVSQFFNLVRTVPEDKFHIHLYSFDDKTYELDIKNPVVAGGGGTAFQPLEDRVQQLIATDASFKKKHPDLVFVLSDGSASKGFPQKPDRWYFLLTENSTAAIPKGANVILLKDFTRNEPKVTVKRLENI